MTILQLGLESVTLLLYHGVMPEIDPQIFEREQAYLLELEITTSACALTDTIRVIEAYDHQQRRAAGVVEEFKQTDDFQQLNETLGSTLSNFFIRDIAVHAIETGEGATPITSEAAVEAREKRSAAEQMLVELVTGLSSHILEQSRSFFDSEAEAIEIAWNGAWSKLYRTIKVLDSTEMADVASLFDGLVRFAYADTYNPMEKYRGFDASEDVSARTFYTTFGQHLGRAITRHTEDGWA